jgi:hypothetical protein
MLTALLDSSHEALRRKSALHGLSLALPGRWDDNDAFTLPLHAAF